MPETLAPASPAPVVIIPPPAFAPVAPLFAMPVSFRNPVALRTALFVGVAAMFFSFVPLVNWLAAGFFAVFFYRRKTQNLLNVGAGMHLGWITGLVMFTMWAVYLLAMGLSGKLAAAFQEQLKNLPSGNDPYVQQAVQIMGSGPGLLIMLAMGFVFITCLSVAGGALGAKIVGRQRVG